MFIIPRASMDCKRRRSLITEKGKARAYYVVVRAEGAFSVSDG